MVFGKSLLAINHLDVTGGVVPVRLLWTQQGLHRIELNSIDALTSSPKDIPLEIKSLAQQFGHYFKGQLKKFEFDWFDDTQCTPFQKIVYTAAAQISFGQTISYSDLAQRIHQPKAVRAVARALAANPWPILIPCHRIKAKNGLGGFSAAGGIKTKQILLSFEAPQ